MTIDEELIETVYVKPIRSVIALDDQFPTIDGLLSEEQSPREEDAESGATVAAVRLVPAEADKARSIVAYCRKRQWIVDIHDGSQVLTGEAEDGVLAHLHQTDLLILDYKLQGETLGGERAIKIVRQLARNEHFNLVIVYTKDEAKGAFREIALSLLQEATIPCERAEDVAQFWEDWAEEDSTTTIFLKSLVDVGIYLYVRRRSKMPEWSTLERAFPNLAKIRTAVTQRAASINGCTIKHTDVMWWLLTEFQSGIRASLYSDGSDTISVMLEPTNELNWLRTRNLFLTVVPKTLEGVAVVDRLRSALVAWRPSPHRLILAALKAELEGRSGAIEDDVMENEYLQAGMLKQLISTDIAVRQQSLESTVENHWVDILSSMKDEVMPTAQTVVAREAERCGNDPNKAVLQHHDWYNDQDKEQASRIVSAVNSYVSTKSVRGSHIATGHVFKYKDEYWICLSPLCDLVPDQASNKRWRASLGDFMPFKAVKLEAVDAKRAAKYASSNLCLFLDVAGELLCFGFVSPGFQGDANPHWEQMFAENRGKFTEGAKFGLSVVRRENSDIPGLSQPEPVQVVAQLRYEYALNLLQRLGSNLCRVGLDYVTSV